MNYIKQLQQTVEIQKREIAALRQGYQDLRIYLSLPKFNQDVYVNKSDIFLRIEESLIVANNVGIDYDNDTYAAEMGFSSEEKMEWIKRNEEIAQAEANERVYRDSIDSACNY